MPRNNTSKYTPAFEVVTGEARRLNVGPEAISKILIEAVSCNRIRINGILIQDVRPPTEGWLPSVPHALGLSAAAIPREYFLNDRKIQPAQYGFGLLKHPSLCDEHSNIFIVTKKARSVDAIIVGARLLNSDVAKVLGATFAFDAIGTPVGVKRSDRIWGEVILHLLELQDRRALGHFQATETLVSSVVGAHPDINPASIRPVLDFVVKRLNSRKGA